MEGFQVVTMDGSVGEINIFTSAIGNFNIITLEHKKKMKKNAIVGNIGHFDNEIDMAGIEGMESIKVQNIKPQVGRFVFPDGHGVIILASVEVAPASLEVFPRSLYDISVSCSICTDLLHKKDGFVAQIFHYP